jgi:hypothetical protein
MTKLPFDFTELVDHVVKSSPSPDRFSGDPSKATLKSLGVNQKNSAGFKKGIRRKIAPWTIAPSQVLTSANTTVANCVLSIHKNLSKPPLDPDEVVDFVVQSTPFPDKYTGDPTKSTLASLGVNPKTAGGFVEGIQEKIVPWIIESGKVITAGNKTVQDCALSVINNAT